MVPKRKRLPQWKAKIFKTQAFCCFKLLCARAHIRVECRGRAWVSSPNVTHLFFNRLCYWSTARPAGWTRWPVYTQACLPTFTEDRGIEMAQSAKERPVRTDCQCPHISHNPNTMKAETGRLLGVAGWPAPEWWVPALVSLQTAQLESAHRTLPCDQCPAWALTLYLCEHCENHPSSRPPACCCLADLTRVLDMHDAAKREGLLISKM